MRTLSPMDHPTDFFTMVPTDVALMTPSSLEPEFPIWISGLCIVRFSCPRHNELATIAGPDGIGVGGDGGRAVQGASAGQRFESAARRVGQFGLQNCCGSDFLSICGNAKTAALECPDFPERPALAKRCCPGFLESSKITFRPRAILRMYSNCSAVKSCSPQTPSTEMLVTGLFLVSVASSVINFDSPTTPLPFS